MKKSLMLAFSMACILLRPISTYSQIHFTAAMDSVQEVPAPTGLVPGKGTGSFTLNDARTELSYSITVTGLSGTLNAGHFHNAPAGTAGPVVRALTFAGTTATGVWKNTDAQPFTPAMLSELLRGRLYINVHTTANPGGEIRGQVMLSTGVAFTAQIDSTQEVPLPSGSVPGKGSGSFTLNAARTQLTYNITLNGLSGSISAAHFHNAPAGTAGSVVRAITFTGNNASGVWANTDGQALSDSMVSELLKGRIYFNVHTAVNPGGEIRGQLGFGNNIVSSVRQVTDVAPATYMLDQNYPNPFNPQTTIRFALPKSERVALRVYNLLGQEVVTLLNEVKPAGSYLVTFNASSLASGMYLYRLSGGNGTIETRKMLLLK